MLPPLTFMKLSGEPFHMGGAPGELTYPDLEELVAQEIQDDDLRELLADFPDMTLVNVSEDVHAAASNDFWDAPWTKPDRSRVGDLKRRMHPTRAELVPVEQRCQKLFGDVHRRLREIYSHPGSMFVTAAYQQHHQHRQRERLAERLLTSITRRTYRRFNGQRRE